MVAVRRGGPSDLTAIGAIQQASPEAAQWNPTDYLEHHLWVADREGRVAGFLVARTLAPGECEILNVAVAPQGRRQGIAHALFAALLRDFHGTICLEVRRSNEMARNVYKSLGFEELAVRPGYYQDPPEPAIVMKFHSC
jgi:[ribosomal protein S18]-alanine N-acetyltransferase